MNELGLGVTFRGVDLASGVMRNVTSELLNVAGASTEAGQAIKSSFQQFSTGLAVFGAGATTLAGAMKLADISGEFSASIAAVGAVSGASVADLKRLEEAALDAGVATQFNPKEAAIGLGDLAQAGYSASESMALLNPVLDLAAGSLGELSPSGAAGLASQTLKAFKIPISEAAITMDRLLQSVNAFALSAGELPLALGTAARGAGVMNQSLSETLIALGLVKNVMPSVERASTSVAVAMERMVDPATQTALKGLGVNVTDADGKFRPFLDIIQELMPALAGMGSESKQSAFLLKTFGTEGLGGIQALLAQLSGGLKTSTGEMVKGAAAVDYLRGSFDHAGGTAKTFADALINTYAGQKKLIAGSMATLAIVAGKPFEAIMAPAATAFLSVINAVLGAIRGLPAPVANAIAKAVVFAGTLMTVVGGILAAKASIGLLGAGLSALGVTTSTFLATLAPAAGILAVLTLAFYGFRAAYQENLGGFADAVNLVYQKVSLAFRALGQLFSQGGFSGAVLGDLENGNSDVEEFAIRIYLVANRVIEFFRGIGRGFEAMLDQAGPAIADLVKWFGRLASALGFQSESTDEAGAAFDRYEAIGQRVGIILGAMFENLIEVLGVVARVSAIFAEKWATFGDTMGPVRASIANVSEAIELLMFDIHTMTGAVGSSNNIWTDMAETLANTVYRVFSFVGSIIRAVSQVLVSLAHVFGGVVDIITGLINNDMSAAWSGLGRLVFGVVQGITDGLMGLVQIVVDVIDALAKVAGSDIQIGPALQAMRDRNRASMADLFGVGTPSAEGTAPGSPSEAPVGTSLSNPDLAAFYGADAPVLSNASLAAFYGTGAGSAGGVVAAAGASGQGADVGALNDSAASLASSAQSLQAAHEGTTVIRATMEVDKRAFGELAAEAMRTSSSDNQVPVSLIP